jgi:hypothetical protein
MMPGPDRAEGTNGLVDRIVWATVVFHVPADRIKEQRAIEDRHWFY